VNVAFLLDRFPVTSQTFVVTQLLGLERAGHGVTVLSRNRPLAAEPVHEEVRDAALAERAVYLDDVLPADSLEHVLGVPLAPGAHDVLHAHFGTTARRFLFARRQAAAPLVVTFHGYDFSAQPLVHGAGLYDPLFEVADVVTANCRAALAALEDLGCPAGKLRLVPVAVDVSTLPFRPRRRERPGPVRILSVGRLVAKKGHEVALAALAAARSRLPPFTFDVIGDGPLAGPLASLVSELRLDDVVRLHGAQDGTVVRRFLAEADVFLLASRTAPDGDREGTPVSLIEAQAVGLPVVSTRHSGIPEVVAEGGGVLVREGDPTALADALVRVVEGHESWPAMGAAGRAHVEHAFDIGACTEALVEVYAEAVAGFAPPVATAAGSRMTPA
jgi:colanic acid/amylovoran biosynthesis glycosyltransferase